MALQHLLQRWGFVKLRRYGLELTSDGRILSTRPVLDDGTGARIVGWRDGDVAIWKYAAWQGEPAALREADPVFVPPSAPVVTAAVPPVPVATAAVAPDPVVIAAVPPPAPAVILQAPAARAVTAAPERMPPPPFRASKPAIPTASAAMPQPARPSAGVMPVEVAAGPPVEEDDWEWTIALARARTAVDDTEIARPPPPAPRRDPSRIEGRAEARSDDRPTTRQAAVPPPRAEPPAARPPERPSPQRIAASARDPVKDPAASGEWPKTEPIGAIDYDDYSRVATRPAIRVPRTEPATVAIPRTSTPNTVIPVPALPTMATTVGSRLEPVVRTAQSQSMSSSAAYRFAKGTGPVDPPGASLPPATLIEDTIPNLSIGDRTRPGVGAMTRRSSDAASSSDDRTRPGIALPPAARAVELPSIKRRTSPRG